MIDNVDTDVNTLETRSRASRGQSTLNIELGLVSQENFNSGSVASATGGGGGAVSGSGVLNSLTGGTTPGGGQCPELDQFICVRSDINTPIPTLVRFVHVGMYLWSPVSRLFEKVTYAEDFESELWEASDGRVTGVGSPSHPLITLEDGSGVPLKDVTIGLGVPAMFGEEDGCSIINQICRAGRGIVRKIETEGPTHTYCAGSAAEMMFWFHNSKRPIDPEF